MIPFARATQDYLRHIAIERGLSEPAAFEAWLAAQALAPEALEEFLRDEVSLRWVHTVLEPEIARRVPDALRARGRYGALRERALDKQRRLTEAGLDNPGLRDAGLDEPALWRWFFETRLGQALPVSLEQAARGLGCPDRDTLLRLVLREYCYQRLLAPED